MLIGINGGYFPAIFRVCFRRQIYEAIAAIFGQSVIYFFINSRLSFWAGYYSGPFLQL